MDKKYQFTADMFSRCEQTWPNIFDLVKWDSSRKCRNSKTRGEPNNDRA